MLSVIGDTFFVNILLIYSIVLSLFAEHTAVIIGLACAGKFFNVLGYCGVHLLSNELFPTPLRLVSATKILVCLYGVSEFVFFCK